MKDGEIMRETLQSKILSMLEQVSPLLSAEIAEELDTHIEIIENELDSLIEQGLIYKNENNDAYYPNMRYRFEYIDKVQKETQEINETAKKELESLKETVKETEKNIKSIYVNIISMMSVFVAIFTLVTVNASFVFNIAKENLYNVFFGIIVLNLFVVFCIIVLLIGVRLIIIRPLTKK